MRGLRVAAMLGLCAFACAKRPMSDTAAPAMRGDAAKLGQAASGESPADAPSKADVEPESPVVRDVAQSLDEMTAELDRFEAELRDQGVRLRTYRKETKGKPPHPRRTPTTPTTRAPTKGPKNGEVATKDEDPCARICTIATTVCELRVRICALADEHAGETRYAAACKRASNDCTRATEACDDCG